MINEDCLYVPYTPGGTALYDLCAHDIDEVWKNLLRAYPHCKSKSGLLERGFRVVAEPYGGEVA